jgi:hypothetical protein
LPLGNNPTIATSTTLNGTLSGSGTLSGFTSGTFTLNAGAALSGFSGLSISNALTVAGATIDFGDYSPASVVGTFTMSSGTFTAPSGTMSMNTITFSGGTFNHNNGTMNFNNTTGTLTCNNATFNLVTFTHSTGIKTVSSGCTLPLGASPSLTTSTGGVTLTGGTLSGTGTISGSALTLTSGSLSGFSGLALGSALTVNGATVDLGSYTTVDLNGSFILSSGSFKAPSGTMTVASTLTFSGAATFDANGGTVTFDGAASTLTCNNVTFNLVVLNNSGTKTIASSCNLPLGNNPTLPHLFTLNGTLSGTGTLTTSNIGTSTLSTGGTLSGFSGLAAQATLSIAGATADFSGYSTFTVASTAASLTLSSGTLTLPNGADINSALIISGGTFNAPSGNMSVAGALTISGSPIFNANNGTVIFDGAAATLTCNNVTFNNVIFDNTTTKTVQSSCNLPLGASPSVGAAITLNGTLTGNGTYTAVTGGMTLNSGAMLSGFSGLVLAGTLTVSGATVDLTSYTTVDINTNFTFSSGSFTAPSGTMTVAGALTFSGAGTFDANGGTLIIDGSTSATLACNSTTFNVVAISHSAGTKTIGSNCTLPLGNNPTVTGAIALSSGTLTGTGKLTTTSAVTLSGSNTPFSGFSEVATGTGLIVSGGSPDLSSLTNVLVNTSFTLSNGVFTAPSGVLSIGTGVAITGGTFNHNNGTVSLVDSSTPSGSNISCNNVTFYRVTISHTTSSKNILSGCDLPLGSSPTMTGFVLLNGGTLTGSGTLTGNSLSIQSGTTPLSGFSGLSLSGNYSGTGAAMDFSGYAPFTVGTTFTVSSGSFVAPTGTMTVGQNFTVSGGTFNHNNGTVVLSGSNQIITGDSTFYNLSKTTSSAATLTLPAGATQTILGTLTLSGSADNLLSLRSSSEGTTWSIDAQGARNLNYLDVKDSNNVSTTTMDVTNSVDSGNNVNWNFIAPAVATTSTETTTTDTPTAETATAETATQENALTKIGDTELSKYPTQFTYSGRLLEPIFSGTGKVGSKVAITANGDSVCTTEVGADGKWSCRSKTLPTDSYALRITFTDTDGKITELPTFTLITTYALAENPAAESDPVSVTSPSDADTSTVVKPAEEATSRYETNIRKLENGQIVVSELRAIVTYKNGKPLANTELTLHSTPQTVTTNGQGVAIFKDVALGEHELVYTTPRNTTIRVPLVVKAIAAATTKAESGEVVTIELSPVEIQLPINSTDMLWLLWPLLAIIGIIITGYGYLYLNHQLTASKLGLSPDMLDRRTAQIQRSTRTSNRHFAKIHNWLRMHSPAYYWWHTMPAQRYILSIVLIVYIGLTVMFVVKHLQ